MMKSPRAYSAISTIGLVGLLATIHIATAAPVENTGHLGWIANLTAESGGDEVARVLFTNNTTQSVNAGQGLGLGVGGHYRFANSGFDLSGTIGIKYVTTQASNADIHLKRTVLEFLGTYIFQNNMWVSVGPVLHQGIDFAGGGIGQSFSFDNASGSTFKAGWKWIGVSYTNIKYQDQFSANYDASNIGLYLVGRF